MEINPKIKGLITHFTKDALCKGEELLYITDEGNLVK